MKPASEHFDAIVVGAGPAGMTAAKRLGQGGFKVLVIDQKKEIGGNIQCAEFVPIVISRHAMLRECDIAQQVHGIKTFINDELANTLHAPGYVLNRGLWEQNLAQMAEAAGVSFMNAARVVGIEGKVVSVLKGTQVCRIETKYILGCDGPRSIVSKKLGNVSHEMCVALQYEMLLKMPLKAAEIYFDAAYYGGYAWVFPKGNKANVGVAVHDSYKDKLKTLLADFCRKLIKREVIQAKAGLATTGGLIPAGGLVACMANEHMLVAGDAAGCTHPITGAGIMNAVVSGYLAAMAVTRHIRSQGRDSAAMNYTQALLAEYGARFTVASDRFVTRNQEWTNNREEFTALIRRSWIAFPEYYVQQ